MEKRLASESRAAIRRIDELGLTDAEMLDAIEECRRVTARRNPLWTSCFDINRHCCVHCEQFARAKQPSPLQDH